ncbi:alpha/beta fold hydrolase [Flavihumibacter petaseus]|uniref:Putative hydrolase n=1 Tax=Flavihumibacter petaseus NBRC 106054 TaxID=1220578 RepID=A0A0E9MV58_9BACT|nr:alpha/beta fold hydrolase [Flavihumibacter petaseus]GAO41454.1 putative hydrolase [Flavihumibacter petaseus NBRC 106054]
MNLVNQELYPFASHFARINGHRYHYVEEGSGDPVVLLHGNPTWSFYYRQLICRLSHQYRCLAPDHIGCGYSDKPGDEHYQYTLEQRVRDLETFLQEKHITGNIHLVMHDWGGIIGMVYAHRHPEAIKKIVLLNTAAFHLPEGKRFPLMLHFFRSWPGAFFIRAFNAFSGLATIEGVKRVSLSRAVRKGFTAPYNSWKNRIATLRFIQDVPLRPGDRGYDTITAVQQSLPQFRNTPVLIAWGMKDRVFDRTILQAWKSYLPNAQVHEFEDSGHYILEDQQQAIGDLITDFFNTA